MHYTSRVLEGIEGDSVDAVFPWMRFTIGSIGSMEQALGLFGLALIIMISSASVELDVIIVVFLD